MMEEIPADFYFFLLLAFCMLFGFLTLDIDDR